jgi:hypothetical protein
VQWEPSCSMRVGGRTGGRTDGRTDIWAEMTKLIVAFRNFANDLEKESHRYFILPTVNRKGNSHYYGLMVIFAKSVWSYSKASTRILTWDYIQYVPTVCCQYIQYVLCAASIYSMYCALPVYTVCTVRCQYIRYVLCAVSIYNMFLRCQYIQYVLCAASILVYSTYCVLPVYTVCTVCFQYIQYVLCAASIYTMYCALPVYTLCTVCCQYIHYVLCAASIYTMYCALPAYTLCTVCCQYIHYVLCAASIYSMYCALPVYTVCTVRCQYIHFSILREECRYTPRSHLSPTWKALSAYLQGFTVSLVFSNTVYGVNRDVWFKCNSGCQLISHFRKTPYLLYLRYSHAVPNSHAFFKYIFSESVFKSLCYSLNQITHITQR